MKNNKIPHLNSALIVAVQSGNLETVNMLIRLGADPHYCEELPFRTALREERHEIADLLHQEYGASLGKAVLAAVQNEDNEEIFRIFGYAPNKVAISFLACAVGAALRKSRPPALRHNRNPSPRI